MYAASQRGIEVPYRRVEGVIVRIDRTAALLPLPQAFSGRRRDIALSVNLQNADGDGIYWVYKK